MEESAYAGARCPPSARECPRFSGPTIRFPGGPVQHQLVPHVNITPAPAAGPRPSVAARVTPARVVTRAAALGPCAVRSGRGTRRRTSGSEGDAAYADTAPARPH